MQLAERKMLYLPRTMADWPWPRAINPHYKDIIAESNAWFRSFNAFNEESQKAFDKCDVGRLAALTYPLATKDQLRTGCDLMNLLFVIDEYTDVEEAPVVREMVDIVIDALNDPEKPRPEGEILLGEIARQFWARGIKSATSNATGHMVESLTAYLNSVVEEAADRDNNRIRTIEEYFENRRENAAARPSYAVLELGMNFPDEVFHHPVVEELSNHITDLLIMGNDIVSYNKEQAIGGDRHNILTVVMNQFHVDLDSAMTWVAEYHKEIETQFLDGLKRLPSWGPEIDKQMNEYIYGLANWARGNDCWSFESGRYFGDKGLEIQKSRLLPFLPKRMPDSRLRRENVVITLIEF